MTVKRQAGRPTRAVLTRESIGLAALELIDGTGFDAMTMKSLASRLGVATSALYNHVKAKTDLWIFVQEILMVRVDAAAFGRLPLPDAMAAWARSYREVFAAHPNVIAGIARLSVADSPHTLAHYETVAAALRGGGIGGRRIVSVIVTFESFIFGAALDASAPAGIFDAAGADPDSYPVFAAAVASRARARGNPADEAFEQGLQALLRILEN